jgi:multiple sugar transport system ATP-binding protein
MRAELKEMQVNFDTTTLYVTHDYMEALSLGDRIVILNEGTIEQIGTGRDIYHRPVNEFVAKLVGEPEINIFPVNLERKGDSVRLEMFGVPFDVPEDTGETLSAYDKLLVDFGIRAQHMQYAFTPPDRSHIKGTVYSFEPIGNKAILVVDAGGTQIRMNAPNDLQTKMNSDIYLTFRIDQALFFDAETKKLVAHAEARDRKAQR